MSDVILNKKVDETVTADKKTRSLFQTVAFRLDTNIYAMDVMNIQEIVFSRKLYKVPNTNEKLLGVLNLRGNILPVYSLKLILGMEDPLKGLNVVNEDDKFIIMIKKEKDVFGIFIDSIYKNITATEDNFKAGKYIERWSRNFLYNGVILEQDKEILSIHIDNLLKHIVSLK